MNARRDGLVTAILDFVNPAIAARADMRAAIEREVDAAGPTAVDRVRARLTAGVTDWEYEAPDALARRLHHALADRFLLPASSLTGVERLAGVAGTPVLVFANHLSYSDANVLEVMLHRHGGGALADRLTAMAGPKVYSSRERRFSSLCFGTIRTPQNAGRSSEDAVMSVRDVARAARRAIAAAHDRLAAGDAVLVFAEGTRSRTGSMQRLLPAVARYLEGPPALVLPIGLTGSEALFPVGAAGIQPVVATVVIGEPFTASALVAHAGGDRQHAMDAIGLAIADLLPESYRGAYADAQAFETAREILRVSHA